MCFRSGNNDSCLWLILIIVVLFCCCGSGMSTGSCDCGCDRSGGSHCC